MTNGIKEKDIRDMQKCFDKMEYILKGFRYIILKHELFVLKVIQ